MSSSSSQSSQSSSSSSPSPSFSSSHSTLGVEFVAGSIAGVVADGATHPVDTVRATLQYQRGYTNLRYQGSTLTVFRQLAKEKALYRGFAMVAATTVPAHGLYFAGYEMSKRQLAAWIPQSEGTFFNHLVSGFVADVFGSFVWVPSDVVKQRVQLMTERSSWEATKNIFHQEGLRGFYRGFWPSLATYGPFVSLYFAGYEQIRKMLQTLHFSKDSLAVQIFSGFSSAAIASLVTNPIDVVKTRIQVDRSYANVAEVIRTTLREEGLRAFAKGTLARVSWIAPSCAIGIAVYEQSKLLLA